MLNAESGERRGACRCGSPSPFRIQHSAFRISDMRTIAHISDLHFGKTDPAVVEGLVADLNAHKPDLLVVSGDFTQRARRGQYEQAAAFLKRVPTPQLVVPGNHDIPMYDWGFVPRFVAPLRNYRRYITNDLRPYYPDDEMIVI